MKEFSEFHRIIEYNAKPDKRKGTAQNKTKGVFFMFDKNELVVIRDLVEKNLDEIATRLSNNEYQYEGLEEEQVEQMLKDNKKDLEKILEKIAKML